jgi:hypothetical protein
MNATLSLLVPYQVVRRRAHDVFGIVRLMATSWVFPQKESRSLTDLS